MTVEDLIQQQASKKIPQKFNTEPKVPTDPEENALFNLYHINGYVRGSGFSIENIE